MPSLILDDFFGDIKIELQLSHIADVDVKNSEMVNQVFCKMKSMEEEIKSLKIDLKNLQCEYDAERCARAPRLWDELKQEMKKVTSHRDRLLRFHKRDTKKIKDMEEDWEVGTEKIANENADLREQIKKLKEKNRKKLKSPDTDYKLLFEVGSTNLSRASYDKEFAECAKLFMQGHFNSYEGWINYRYYE